MDNEKNVWRNLEPNIGLNAPHVWIIGPVVLLEMMGCAPWVQYYWLLNRTCVFQVSPALCPSRGPIPSQSITPLCPPVSLLSLPPLVSSTRWALPPSFLPPPHSPLSPAFLPSLHPAPLLCPLLLHLPHQFLWCPALLPPPPCPPSLWVQGTTSPRAMLVGLPRHHSSPHLPALFLVQVSLNLLLLLGHCICCMWLQIFQ